MSESGPRLLKDKYALHKAPETESAAKRTRARTKEKVPQDPASQISNYLARFREILDRPDPDSRERGMNAIKKVMHARHVIKPSDIPEGYFQHQQQLAREQGHGDIEITEEQREQLAEVITTDQRSSLNIWIDYLSSPDATYPDWLKYFAIRGILGMGEYDKATKAFTKRSKGTTKPFPDLNREALAYVLDAIERNREGTLRYPHGEFTDLLKTENFAKLYAWAIEKVTPSEKNLLTVTEGRWVKYPQNSDHMPLVQSLQGHGTGWCTAGESTAQAQLTNGDFYVYYTLNQSGEPSIPRAAIRMQGSSIGEVRGVAADQNLDAYIAPVVQNKLKDFPDGSAYEKKASDMKHLTDIERRVSLGHDLSHPDLAFLYELDAPIEGFGYQKDPRIAELRKSRSPVADMPILFDCAPHQIATTEREIRSDTKAYVGRLFQGIFNLPLERIYTRFPEGRVTKIEANIGGRTGEELIGDFLGNSRITLPISAEKMLRSKDFVAQKTKEKINLVRLSVADLGFPSGASTEQIYQAAEKLSLELCPPEVGPHLRLQYEDQPKGEYIAIAMKPIMTDGSLCVFAVRRHDGGLWLHSNGAGPADQWDGSSQFVFRARK